MEDQGAAAEGRSSHPASALIRDAAAQNEMLASIVQHALVPIFFKDRSGVYLYVNEAYELLGGLPKEEIIGRKDRDIYPKATALAYRSEDVLAMKATAPLSSTWPLDVGGERRVLRTVKFPIRDGSGDVVGVAGVSIDITDSLVVKRTREIEREQRMAAQPFERLMATLTPQEKKVAELLLIGLPDKQIAEILSLNADSVRHHVSHILKKLRKPSRTLAVIEMLKYRKRNT